MLDFNRMTIVAATEVVFTYNSHNDIEPHLVQWDLSGRCNASSKTGRAAALAKIAIEENPQVYTVNGKTSLSEAIVDMAINAPPNLRASPDWRKLVAGLKLDGFEISGLEEVVRVQPSWMDRGEPKEPEPIVLRRMLPNDLPGLDMREAENEVDHLLDKHSFDVPKGHLKRALSAFQRGEWSSSNAELRNIHEGVLNDIADRLGYSGGGDALAKRNFLGGELSPPFLLSEYNEWHLNTQRPQYVQGLMSRMHPHGSHPGLSEEEDATFRMQITLITMRLFLRRYDQRVAK